LGESDFERIVSGPTAVFTHRVQAIYSNVTKQLKEERPRPRNLSRGRRNWLDQV
jgi:hypothetical protein